MSQQADEAIERSLFGALEAGDIQAVRELCTTHPWLIKDHLWTRDDTWLQHAVRTKNLQMLSLLLDLGFNIDATDRALKSTALTKAMSNQLDSIVDLLLARGANPDLGRAIISAINNDDDQRRMRYLDALVKAGVDVNQQFPLFSDQSKLFTALDWSQKIPEVAELLRRHGAKTAAELKAGGEALAGDETDRAADVGAEVVTYFHDHHGVVDGKTWVDVLPAMNPFAIHVIWPSRTRKHITLFTNGLSRVAMKTPPDSGEYAYAELYIELPGSYKAKGKRALTHEWPLNWLHKIAQHPHDNDTWLGGPLTIIANGDPPEPLDQGLAFTSIMLLVDESLKRSDGQTVQLYRLVPLYTEERELELAQGAPALLRAFDRQSVPFIFAPNRSNVASH